MKFGVKSTKAVIAPGNEVYVEATMEPPAPPATGQPRKPVAVMMVFDRSGSMSEHMEPPLHRFVPAIGVPPLPVESFTKIDCTKLAAERMVDMLEEQDYAGIVSFSTLARVEIPLQRITPENKAKLIGIIRQLRAHSTTNIEDGLQKAFDQFERSDTKGIASKIILLSDGIANVGVSDADGLASIVSQRRGKDITVSALGIGASYEARTMTAIAQAGMGQFYHIEKAEQIETIVAQEIADTMVVTARDVKLDVRVPDGAAIGDNLNGYPQAVTEYGVQITMGDLSYMRTVVLEISMPVEMDGSSFTIDFACSYGTALGKERQTARQSVTLAIVNAAAFQAAEGDNEVSRRVGHIIAANAVANACIAYDGGDMVLANVLFCRASDAMSSPALDLGDEDSQQMSAYLADCREQMASNKMSANESKVRASLAYGAIRSRPKR